MKKVLSILTVLFVTTSAFAEGVLDKTTVVATASYVDGAVNSLQDKLSSTGQNANVNVTTTANTYGTVITDIGASNGTVSVTKGDVVVPVKDSNSQFSGTATIWIQ